MRDLFLIFSFLLIGTVVQGQTISVISLDQLEQRLENGSDTSFVVNFWATWCGPCVKELPYFDQLTVHAVGTKTKVLLVSLDFAEQLETKVIPFAIERGLKSEVILMDEAKPNKWIPRVSTHWSGAIPATLFVNTQKKTRHFYEGSFNEGELELKLQKLGL